MVVRASSSAGTGQFAVLLRRYRIDAGLTQGALAEQAGVSARTIQHLEAGMGQPQADTTRRLTEALGLEAEARASFLAASRPAPRRGVRVEPHEMRAADDGAQTASLPVRLTSFIGRERERGQVQQLLDGSRLVTLIGLGGLGKTRLALVVAAGHVASTSMSATLSTSPQLETEAFSRTLCSLRSASMNVAVSPFWNGLPHILDLAIIYLSWTIASTSSKPLRSWRMGCCARAPESKCLLRVARSWGFLAKWSGGYGP
jgi:transcriptional regulator with XRE-family HTH domain